MTQRTLQNGDIVQTRLVRHRTGDVSIKRKTIGTGAPPAPAEAPPRPSLTPQQARARQGEFLQRKAAAKRPKPISLASVTPTPVEPATKSAARNARKAKALPPAPITAAPKTIQERTHHEHSVDQAAYVTTTNAVPKLLRRIKARTGSHVELFQKDYELAGSDLRSATMDGAGGGGSAGVPFPMAKVMAIERLKEFERSNLVAFTMCEAVLIYDATPASIHAAGGPQHVVVSHMIREAIEDLAGFYTPQRKRPDKVLAIFTKFIDEARRKESSLA